MVVGDSTMASPGSTSPKRTLCKGSKFFDGVDVQQTSDVGFCHRIYRGLKMDASVPVDSWVFMQNVPCGDTLLTAGSRKW